jgi:hypothetical protein
MPYNESEELLIAWHDDDGASTPSNFQTTTSSLWAGQSFVPDWSVVAPGQTVISYYPTKIDVRVGKTSGTGAFNFQVKRTDANHNPTGSALDAVALATGSVPTIASSTTQPPWTTGLTFPLSAPYVFYATEWAVIQYTPTGLAQTGYIGQQTGGTVQSPSDQVRVNSTNAGTSWVNPPSSTIDLLIRVYGRYKVIPGVAVPTLDAATTDTIATGTGATTRTFAHTVGVNDGNDTALYVGIPHQSTSETDGMCVGVTYAGLDMQEVFYSGAQSTASATAVIWVKWYRLINPPAGTDNVVATFSTANHEGVLCAASFFHVHQSEPEGETDAKLAAPASNANKVVGIIGDMNLVAAVWNATTATSTATPQGNTVTIGGSESAANIYGCVVGYSVGDVATGWKLNLNFDHAVGIVGVNHVQGVNWSMRESPFYIRAHDNTMIGGRF